MSSQQQASTTPADARDEWRTPQFVFDYMDRVHNFTVDLAATFENALCALCITRREDALSQDWNSFEGPAWINPPYSNIEPWLVKARNEAALGFTSVLLLPSPNGHLAYGKHVFDVASEVLFIHGRLSFLSPEGKPRTGNTVGSMLVTYRGFDLGQTRYRSIFRHEMEKRAAAVAAEGAEA